MASVDTEEAGDVYTMVDPSELIVRPPFSSLFPIDPGISESVTLSMKERGYDYSKPINVWRRENTVIDGHTRRLSAIDAGIRDVPVCFHDFKDEDEALYYAVKSQTNRRNLTDPEIYRVLEEFDRRIKVGRPKSKEEITPRGVISGRAKKDIAKEFGISERKLEAFRTIEDHAEKFPDIKDDVKQGKKSLRGAARAVGDRKRKEKQSKPYEPVIPAVSSGTKDSAPIFTPISNDEATEGWLASHPLRARVVASRFDEDALIYRRFATQFGAIRGELQQLIGARTDARAGTLYRALLRVSPLPAINTWAVCTKCGGRGQTDKRCSACRGGGYVIPGF